MQNKIIDYSIAAVLLCAIMWTVYSNFFQTKHTTNQSIAIGSHSIELAKEDNTEVDVENDHSDIEIDNHNDDEFHNNSDQEYHLHEINTTEVLDLDQLAPQFITKTLGGETVQLSDFLGQRVILNFWTTWCPPCQEEIPELQKFYETSLAENNVILLGVNITNEDLGIDVIHDFRDYYKISYPILLDETGEITDSFKIISIPTTYVIDENGNIEKEILGPLTNAMLNEILSEEQ